MAFNDKSGGPWGGGSGQNNGGPGGNPWGGGTICLIQDNQETSNQPFLYLIYSCTSTMLNLYDHLDGITAFGTF